MTRTAPTLVLPPVLALAIALALPGAARAQDTQPPAPLRLASLFTDGMVLQRDSVVPLWGHGEPGAEVVVQRSWDPKPTRAWVEEDGTWRLRVHTPPAGGPYDLRFAMGDDVVNVEDVLSGEVWLASGQSNMEFKVASCQPAMADYEERRQAANFPTIRFFDEPNRISLAPEADCAGSWEAITPDTWPNVSAVAFFFAKELADELDVPVGVIDADWGGTVAESWTGASTLWKDFPEFRPALERIAQAASGQSEEPSIEEQQARWWDHLRQVDPGSRESWERVKLDLTGWGSMGLPVTWEDAGLQHDGVVWFRRTVDVPAAWAGHPLELDLGGIDDMDTTFWDGKKVGGMEVAGRWQTPRRYTVPAESATAGTHVIAVRVVDTGGAGGLRGPAGSLHVGPVDVEGAEPLSLEGPWRYRPGINMHDLGDFPSGGWFHPNQPTALFNGMIAPLVGYGLRGAIWYQGEANVGRARQYERLFPAMITDWRQRWDRGDFPFLFVQIAPFSYGNDTGQAADLRDAQRKSLALGNTGMAVTMDIGNPGNIHPKDKWDVGHRLALWARALAYGESDVDVSGPLYSGIEVEGAKIRVHFTHADEGLVARGGPLMNFTVAGEDQVFHPAEATIDGTSVVVSSKDVPAPVAVRFAWGAADASNLFDAHGLPASSFRSDDWPIQ